MGWVTVLAAADIDLRRVAKRLIRAGHSAADVPGGMRFSRPGAAETVVVTALSPADVPDVVREQAGRLLGLAPRDAVGCSFPGQGPTVDSWTTVLQIAKIVAVEVPLAVLCDEAGTVHLVHPDHGLIGPQEYGDAADYSAGNVLRRLFGRGF